MFSGMTNKPLLLARNTRVVVMIRWFALMRARVAGSNGCGGWCGWF
jgi:hypothetical protein